jgi:hypothetical protein
VITVTINYTMFILNSISKRFLASFWAFLQFRALTHL